MALAAWALGAGVTPSAAWAAGAPHAGAQPARSAVVLDHLAIYVSDLGASTAFYKSVFGLEEKPAPFSGARWLVIGNGVMLHIVAGRTKPVTNSSWDHFAIACADMDAMIASLQAKKIAWADMQGHAAPQVRPDGVKQIFIRDPDGYWIEINDALKAQSPPAG